MNKLRTRGDEGWLTKAQIAAHLKCSPRYVNTLMRRGILPYLKTRGFLRFNPDDCSRALERFKTRSRFSLDNQRQPAKGLAISSASLVAPLPPEASTAGTPDESNNITTAGKTICARVFESPEQAGEYLQQLIVAWQQTSRVTARALSGTNKEAPITVIILQSAPCI